MFPNWRFLNILGISFTSFWSATPSVCDKGRRSESSPKVASFAFQATQSENAPLEVSPFCRFVTSTFLFQLSPHIVTGLHQLAQSIGARDYATGIRQHSHIVSSSNFSEISAFMPGLKSMLQVASHLNIWKCWESFRKCGSNLLLAMLMLCFVFAPFFVHRPSKRLAENLCYCTYTQWQKAMKLTMYSIWLTGCHFSCVLTHPAISQRVYDVGCIN